MTLMHINLKLQALVPLRAAIDKIIKFLNTSSIKLLGHKRLQYIIWLNNLRTVDRF